MSSSSKVTIINYTHFKLQNDEIKWGKKKKQKQTLMNQTLKSSIHMLLKFIEKKAHTTYRSLYSHH